MKARIIEQTAMLYPEPTASASPILALPAGSEIDLGQVKKAAGLEWVSASLPNGQSGYVLGQTKIFRVKHATVLQDNVDLHSEPSESSSVTARYKKNDTFDLTDTVTLNGKAWVKTRDSAGTEGFIDGKTRVRTQEVPATKESAQKNMLVGALMCIGGILVTAITYSSVSDSGGTYIIAWGPVIFGGWRFLKGFFQFLSSE